MTCVPKIYEKHVFLLILLKKKCEKHTCGSVKLPLILKT